MPATPTTPSRSNKRARAPSPIYPPPNPIAPYFTVTSILWDPRYTSVGRPGFGHYYKQYPEPPPQAGQVVDDSDGIDELDDFNGTDDDYISDDDDDDDEDLYDDKEPEQEKEALPRVTARQPEQPLHPHPHPHPRPHPQEKLKRARSRTRSRSRSRSSETTSNKKKEVVEEGKVIQNTKNSVMEKRHPSSFQQLEKLGEGTYATVGLPCNTLL